MTDDRHTQTKKKHSYTRTANTQYTRARHWPNDNNLTTNLRMKSVQINANIVSECRSEFEMNSCGEKTLMKREKKKKKKKNTQKKKRSK